MAATQEQIQSALNNAVKLDIGANDIDLIRSLTGMTEPDNKSIRKALDSIYINGKNLTDKLGEEKENDIGEYARAIREALAPENSSFVTLMNRNSVIANPRAVISAEMSTESELDAKTEASVRFAAEYRENMHNAAKEAYQKFDAMTDQDAHIFFDPLFGENENTDNLSGKELCVEATKNARFNPILPNFVNGRMTTDYVYLFMLTKDYPKGSGKELTWEQLFKDNSAEMQAYKKEMGEEFCRVFRKPKNDDVKHFNEVTYPTLIEMEKACLKMQTKYHDLSDKDQVFDFALKSFMIRATQNLAQQMKYVDLRHLGTLGGIENYENSINEQRLKYLSADSYLNDSRTPQDFVTEREAVKAQSLIDNVDMHDIKKLENAGVGVLEAGQNSNFLFNLTAFRTMSEAMEEDIDKYKNGDESGRLTQNWQNGVCSDKFIKDAAIAAERGAEKSRDEFFTSLTPSKDGMFASLNYNEFIKRYNGENVYSEGGSQLNPEYNGIKRTLINDLVGCPTINKTPDKITPEDKKLMMNAVNAIYINNKTMAEYFNLNENNVFEKINDAEKNLSTILLNSLKNNGPEFVFVRRGKDNFAAPYFSNFGNLSREEKNAINNSTKTAKAYASILSGNADEMTVAQYSDKLKELGMEPPVVNIRLDMAMEIMGQSKTGNVLSDFMRKRLTTPQEFEDAAKNIYIGNKTLAELCPKRENMSDEECTRQREQLLKDNFKALSDGGTAPKPMSMRDKNGVLKPLKIVMGELPPEPKPVSLYTDFQKHFHFEKTIKANQEAYDKYIAAKERYDEFKALHDRCTKYNGALEDARVKIIREERSGPTQVAMNVDQLQMSRNGLTAQNNNPSLTQPTVQRGAQQNERTRV